MPLEYPIPESLNQNWAGAQDWLTKLLGQTFDPNQQTQPPAYQGMEAQRPQSLPELMAGMMINQTPKDAYESGMIGMGPMPLISYPEFKNQIAESLLDRMRSGVMRVEADRKFRPGPGSVDYINRQIKIGNEGVQQYISDYGNIMKAVKDLETKLPEIGTFVEPIKKASTDLYKSSGFNSSPYAYFTPGDKSMSLIAGQLRDVPQSKIANAIIHEGVHGLQYAEPGIGSELYNRQMDELLKPYYNLDELFNFFKGHDKYRYMDWGYFSKPEEIQAHGVANLLTKKLYPEYQYTMPYPEHYNKHFMDTIDYLLSKGKQ